MKYAEYAQSGTSCLLFPCIPRVPRFQAFGFWFFLARRFRDSEFGLAQDLVSSGLLRPHSGSGLTRKNVNTTSAKNNP